MSISDIIDDLRCLDFEGDFIEDLDRLTEQLAEEDVAGEAIEPVLRFLEEHRDTELGMPGPLVHYVEKYFRRGYEEKLLQSLNRAPTPRTVWMLNRILNGLKASEKESYLQEIRRLTTSDDAEVAELARRFERLHQE